MIISGNSSINKVYYNGYTISKIYACGGSLVWSGDTPTPPTGDKFTIRYDEWSGETFYTASCNSDSTITMQETTQSPYSSAYATDVVIGDCVTSIGDSAFNRFHISSVTFSNSITEIGVSAFYTCQNLTSVELPQSLVIIGGAAFEYCSSLTSITIPNSVTSIGGSAFFQCSGLKSVTIGSGVTSIGSAAFGACSGLTSIDIPNSVASIGGEAFHNCSGLTSANIGSGVTTIGQGAFEGCRKLSSVTVNATTPPSIGQHLFRYTSDNLVIYVPNGSVDVYKSATNWSTYASRIQAIP